MKNTVGNPLWKAGAISGNPNGRPKSIRSVSGMLEAFIKRNISPQQLKKLFSKLSAQEQSKFLLECLPYVMAKKSADVLTSADIDQLYEKLQEATNASRKAI